MKKCMIRFLTILCLVVFMGSTQVFAAAEDNNYIAADGTPQPIPSDATTVSSSDTAWNAGWYVVDSNVEITSIQFELTGDVHLVLKDGCTLNITGCLYVGSGSLYIYGQSGGTGTLTVQDTGNGSYNTVALYVYDDLIIYGGTVNAHGTATASTGTAVGISATNIFVNGGTVNVTATGVSNKAYGISGATTISGGTVTLNATGKDAANTRLFDRTMTVNDEGTIVLPANMNKYLVMNLGITGTGGIKFGNAHIGTDGDCITHNWDARIKQKDTTQHYTMGCRTCNINDEATVAACEYDNACDTNCNICGIVRTITHQYGEDGFCTVCRYSDTPAVDSDGDGYVEIDSAGELWWFTHQVKNGQYDLNAELTANIDLSGTCGDGIGNWLPISHEDGYTGNFNGQGHTISNLYMSGDDQYIGLFGYVKGATIENVTVIGSISSTFSHIYYPDTYESFDGAAGGVVAYLDGGTIRNCHVDMTVSGGYNIGGICGMMDSNGVIENCTSNGAVTNPENSDEWNLALGGIAGFIWSGTVRNCTNYAAVSSTNGAYIGGIAAYNYGTIENCVNYSNLISHEGVRDALGGIAECNDGTIRNCGNYGNISGYDVGGIVCQNFGAVENCCNVGTVSGTSGNFDGPISGLNQGGSTTTNNYYLSDTTTEDGGRTAKQFANGQVAYELNGSTTTDGGVWKQTLGTDTYPVLTGEPVYCVTSQKCDGTDVKNIYSNSSEDIIEHADTDSDGDAIYDTCGSFTFAGAGTQSDPYIVTTIQELNAAVNSTANATNYVKLGRYIVPGASFGAVLVDAKTTPFVLDLAEYYILSDGRFYIRTKATIQGGTARGLGLATYAISENADVLISGVQRTPSMYAQDGALLTFVNCTNIQYLSIKGEGSKIVADNVTVGYNRDGFAKIEGGTLVLDGVTHTESITELHYPYAHIDADGDCRCDVGDEWCHRGEDDGDCTTAVTCTCGHVITQAAEHDFTGDYLFDTEGHWRKCANCDQTDTPVAHSGTDDGDCTTDDLCSVCGAVATAGNENHSGGNATCTEKAECAVCGTAYGELGGHSYGEDGKCVCGAEKPADDELPADTDKAPGFFARLWNAIVWLFWLIVNFFASLFGIAKA